MAIAGAHVQATIADPGATHWRRCRELLLGVGASGLPRIKKYHEDVTDRKIAYIMTTGP